MTYTPATMKILVKIDGTDRSSYVSLFGNNTRGLPGVEIRQEIGKAFDEMTLALMNAGGQGLENWQEVVVSNLAETETYFGGYIQSMQEYEFATDLDYVCTVVDYTVDMDKSIINLQWEDKTDAQILADIRTESEPALTGYDFSTHVTNLGTLENFRSQRVTVREALDELAARLGADWYIDYDKNLHWFDDEDLEADFSLSDDPDYTNSFPYQNLVRESEGVGVLNRITVLGGNYKSDNVVHVYAGDGQQVRFVVPHFYHKQTGESAVIVEKNTGSDVSPTWTAQTVGVKYIDDDGSYDVLFAYAEKYFEFATAPDNLVSSWRVKARYEAPLRVRVRSQASYDQYGRWFEGVLENTDLEDKATARLYGQATLAKNALERVVYTLGTDTPGLRVGEVVPLVNSLRSIDDSFLIQRLTRRFVGGGWVRDELELGDYLEDLYGMMLNLARGMKKDVDYREDEVLDELFDFLDSFSFGTVSTSYSTSNSPYTWGSGGANDFNWGFGAWS